MKIFILLLLPTLAWASIRPGEKQQALTNDLYFSYQWGLQNAGQVVIGDIDDIRPYETKGQSWADIDWNPKVDEGMTRDVVVAVIDSGVDIEHEDLKGQILLNDSECNNGKIPLQPTGDRDQNGFDGDCAGWNFASTDKRRMRLVDDDVGHGTHVAGIIAANVNNGIGISGLSRRIKILPLKVYDSKETSSAKKENITDRVAKAIDYAVMRKVDVINMSLGWPLISHNDRIREAIQKAEAAGVLIVAAAGNDRHEAQIYPCAMDEVFCVGSINVDGEVSRFSNFGGHVDILAPGGQILSLIPSTISSDFFGIRGYEIKFGTSQAAPFVAGAAAILKGTYPQLPNQKIKEILMKSARPVAAMSNGLPVFSQAGLLQINRALNSVQDLQDNVYVWPSFKEFNRVVLKGTDLIGTHTVALLNGQLSQEIQVRSLNPDVVITAQGAPTEVKLTFQARHLWANAIVGFELRINGRTFKHQILLSREVPDTGLNFEVSPANLMDQVASVPTPFQVKADPRYFRFVTETKTVEVYALKNAQFKKILSVVLPEISVLPQGLGLVRLDIDQDGQLDYWISGVVQNEKGETQGLRYYFVKENGETLVKKPTEDKNLSSKFEADYVLPTPKSTRFIQVTHPELGRVSIPVFLSMGRVEVVDQNKDPFARDPEMPGSHIYYVWPTKENGEYVWRTRTLSNRFLQAQLRENLKLPSYSKFEFLVLRQPDEVAKGEISLLMRTGEGILQKYYNLRFQAGVFEQAAIFKGKKPKFDLTTFSNSYDFSQQAWDVAYSIRGQQVQLQTILKGQFAKDVFRILTLDEATIASVHNFKTQDPREFIGSLIRQYNDGERSISFYELDTRLELVIEEGGKKKITSSPIYRTSFLQGSVFSLRFIPLVIQKNGKNLPMLYVDNSALLSPTIYSWVVENDHVFIPLKYSYEIPTGCRALNPFMRDDGVYNSMLCAAAKGGQQKTSANIRLLPF